MKHADWTPRANIYEVNLRQYTPQGRFAAFQANHTAWDHRWVSEHPEWYLKNAAGEIHSYVYDNGRELEYWTDVVGLDYRQPAVWNAQIEALKFWFTQTGIDGFCCDVAGLVPTPFWERARAGLDAIRPVFMLAEWSTPELHAHAFDMTYDWLLHDALKKIASGQGSAADLVAWLEQTARTFPRHAYRMTFTNHHDKNAWEGQDAKVFGPAFQVCAVLAATLPGMPLIYGGQEAVLDKRLAFFEKDTIAWKDCALADFYRGLLQLKTETPALWNGEAGAPVQVLDSGTQKVFAFRRRNAQGGVEVAANLSGAEQAFEIEGVAQRLAAWSWTLDRLPPACAPPRQVPTSTSVLSTPRRPLCTADAAPRLSPPWGRPAPTPPPSASCSRPGRMSSA